jgi:hypothetical protein
MPTRKQRRRRDKTFRHEYETVYVDEEGNETPLAELRAQEPKKEKPAAKATPAKNGKGRSARPVREVPPPSWERALKRGGTWGAVMLVLAVFFLFRNQPLAVRVGWGLVYAVMFVPLTYFVDRTAYRAYLRRTGAAPKRKKS